MRGRVSRLAWYLLCAAAGSGCSAFFGLEPPAHEDAGRSNDGNATDGIAADGVMGRDAATACASPILYEPFVTKPVACAPWGTSYSQSAVLKQANGLLSITLAGTTSAVAGCLGSTTYPFGSGVTAIVDEVLEGNSSYTVLAVHGPDVQLNASNGLLRFQTSASTDIGTATYSATMKWWRIRPLNGSILGEVSTDGTTWVLLGAVSVSSSQGINVEITGGTVNGSAGNAVFDEVMICP